MTSTKEDTLEAPVLARQMVRGLASAALSTVSAEGQPHASLVVTACDLAARPVLLISSLAVHTQNRNAEPRVALLYEDCRDLASPLTGPRLTVSGELKIVEDSALRDRFLRRHPDAEVYADFTDFDFYRLEINSLHLVAGFGRIETISADDYVYEAPGNTALGALESEIVAHMNADHAEAVDLYGREFARQSPGAETPGWTMTGIDPEGFDLRRAAEVARVNFEAPLSSAAQAREKLVALVNLARDQA